MPTPVGTILHNSPRMPFHTDMQRVLRAFGGREREFDWLVTDLECNRFPAAFLPEKDAWLLSGDEFADVVFGESDPVQYIWGVLTGLPRGTRVDLAQCSEVPFADGNGELWTETPRLQVPGAVVEVVCWDSSYTILVTTDADLSARFRSSFPEAEDLAVYCRRLR